MGVLAEDDFGGFPVGPLYEPYSALGEYHVPGNLRRYGIWTESTVYHAWRSAIWMVLEEEGHHVLEQTRLSRHRTPILTCGDGSWEDCEISVRMRPLSVQGEAGIVFRYRDCRSFYVAGFRDGEMFIGAREHEERETLASAPAEYLDSGYFDMKVTAAGSRLRAEGAGVVLEAEDARYGKGKAGLLAECPVRFTDFRVEGDAGKAAAARRRRVSEEERERAGYPKAVLKERFPLKDFGTGRQIRFGDIDGDGRKEIVLAQCIHRASGDFPSINLLTALKSSGEVLWQIGEASPGRTIATADLPFQAADVDGDGQTEVIFIKDHFIHVA
ncbi:MAG: hypothetical protein JW909_11650, partial [Planctomycetes bacterium]|nr:hypothetical protein [Planctomycetota bacterium]